MSQILGKVTGDLEVARGPDVEMRLTVERSWWGAWVRVQLPRTLNCAVCGGGGCDRCGRAGGLRIEEPDAEPRQVEVLLPSSVPQGSEIIIRVPEQGALDQTAKEHGRGHLLLRVKLGERSDPGVVLCARAPLDAERALLIRRSVIMATLLIALFVGLLKLSGWL